MLGETIGNHRIVRQLGMGGMGEVFLAEHQKLGTKVAIKFLLPHISANEALVRRFFNEAIAASKIAHAGIVKVFDSGHHHSGRAYLVMEFLEGESLASRIQRTGRLAISQISEIGRQVSSILEATHRAGIIHRDLKPDNIFLIPDGELASGERVKILDFGIAKLTDASGGATSTSMGAMGTPAYMAPEQWMNAARVDGRADIYSLGCLTFEMACGRPPFVAASFGEACTQHLGMAPPRIRELVPSLPAQLDTLVSQTLAKAPEARPSNLREIAKTFAELAAGPPDRLDPAASSSAAAHAATLLGPSTGPVSAPVRTTLSGASASLQQRPGAHGSRRMWIVLSLVLLSVIGVLGVTVAILISDQKETGSVAAAPGDGAGVESPAPTGVPEAPAPPAPASGVAAAGAEPPAPPPPDPPPPKADATAELEAQSSKPGAPVAKPARRPVRSVEPAPEPPEPVGTCDEVSCVLNNYEGRCCQKFRKGGARPRAEQAAATPPSELPEKLDRAMIAEGIAKVKASVMRCGDSTSAKGTVKVSVKVAPDGTVASASVTDTPHSLLGECVAVVLRRATFRKTLAGGAFAMPFVF